MWLMEWFLTKITNSNQIYIGKDCLKVLAQGQTQGSTLQKCTSKTLTTGPFDNTCEEDEVSPEVEAGVVAGLQCLQP
jgi:hypothetical protein